MVRMTGSRWARAWTPALAQERPARRRRRGLRIALVTLASFVVLIGAVAAGGYFYLNHLAGSIQRIPVKFAAVSQPAGANYGGAMTVLITGKGIGPTGAMSVPENSTSGLIMLLHVNASGYSGGVVSIPPQSIVRVPGHGKTELENALKFGGPDLLVRTVENLTHVQINHYARIDFTHVDRTVNAIGGVNVTLPENDEQLRARVPCGSQSPQWAQRPEICPAAFPDPGRPGAAPAEPDAGRDPRDRVPAPAEEPDDHVPGAARADQHAHRGQQLSPRPRSSTWPGKFAT